MTKCQGAGSDDIAPMLPAAQQKPTKAELRAELADNIAQDLKASGKDEAFIAFVLDHLRSAGAL